MKLTKTQWIIAIAVLAVAIWYFFFKDKDKKNDESGYKQACPSGWKCPGTYCEGQWSKNPNTGEVQCKRGSRPGIIS